MDYKNLIIRIPVLILLILAFTFMVIINDQYIRLLVYPIYLIIFIEIIIFFRQTFLIFFISSIYLIFSFICFQLYLNNFYIREELIFIILLVIFFDISSYFFGSMFGRSKILPSISPKKTYFGLISGLISAFLFGLLYNYYYQVIDKNFFIIFIIISLSLAFIGDTFESILKRKSNIKNSSNILLGHGGFFDRFDSLIMVVIWLFFFNLIK